MRSLLSTEVVSVSSPNSSSLIISHKNGTRMVVVWEEDFLMSSASPNGGGEVSTGIEGSRSFLLVKK